MTLTDFVSWWDDLSDPKVATPASTLADLKDDIEKLCSFEKICTMEVQTAVKQLSAKVSTIQSQAKKVMNGSH